MPSVENPKIILYGNSWCSDCYRAKLILNKLKIEFNEIDIGADHEGLEFVLQHNHGNASVPTIVFPDGSILVEPSNKDLKAKLSDLVHNI